MNSSLIAIILCLIFGIGFFIFKKTNSIKKSSDSNTAQEFINVKDIKDNFLYTFRWLWCQKYLEKLSFEAITIRWTYYDLYKY